MIPTITKDLMDHLLSVFPNRLPLGPTSPDQLGVLQGQQKVVSYLEHLF